MATQLEIDEWVYKNPRRPHFRAGSDSRHLGDLKRAAQELYRVTAEGNDLIRIFSTQDKEVHSGIERLVRTLSAPDLSLKMERHQAVAAEQTQCAKGMIKTARAMSEHALEMRKPPHRRPASGC